MKNNINLYIDFGSTFTKVTAIDIDKEEVIDTAKAFTTVETDISEGLNHAIDNLFKQTGKLEFKDKYACSSAAGGLKMITIGLVPQLTAEASKRAALGAGAKILKVYSYKLTEQDINELKDMDVDIILLCGGTDGGNKDNIIYNSHKLNSINKDIPIIYAGNREAAFDCRRILEKKFSDIRITDNVMPELNILNVEPVRKTIREVFLERIVKAKGFLKTQRHLSGILMPTPYAVLNAAKLLSQGAGEEHGIGELMVVDPGGATTDVHSIAKGYPTKEGVCLKGLNEPFEKRTVEGDLGLRYSLKPLVESCGIDTIKKELSGIIDQNDVESRINFLIENKDFIPESEKDKEVDSTICKIAVEAAVQRHVGRIETSYTPFGASYSQYGKDLTQIKYIVGTGGAVVNSNNPASILKRAFFNSQEPNILKPIDSQLLIDDRYIMYSLGLMGELYPEKAVRMLKMYIVKAE